MNIPSHPEDWAVVLLIGGSFGWMLWGLLKAFGLLGFVSLLG
jgi:hypothetical protein